MTLDPGLRAPKPDPYVYRSGLKRALARGLDSGLKLFLQPPAGEIPWAQLRRVALLRLDHLGDVLNVLPALSELCRLLPKAEIELIVGPWGAEIASLGAGRAKVVPVEAPWFDRPRPAKWPLGSIVDLGESLRHGHYDLVIEARGELRNMAACALSAASWRLGHAQTAGGALLSHAFAVDNRLHESRRNLDLLRRGGLPVNMAAKVKLKVPKGACKIKLPRRFIAVQAGSGQESKKWMAERWVSVLDRLGKRHACVLLGNHAERPEMLALAARCRVKPMVAAGQLNLSGLAELLSKADRVLSVDSGPAHLAAMLGRPVTALMSATNDPAQWAPQGRVKMLRHDVPCSPCELTKCPYGNECMRRIEVEEVMEALA